MSQIQIPAQQGEVLHGALNPPSSPYTLAWKKTFARLINKFKQILLLAATQPSENQGWQLLLPLAMPRSSSDPPAVGSTWSASGLALNGKSW